MRRLNPDDFDGDPWLLNVRNGTIDLRTGKLLPHNPENLLTKVVSVDYDPAAQCPLWETFLDRIMAGNAELIEFLQRVVGYCLTGSTREQIFCILHGTGANGKSTIIKTIIKLLGDYAWQAPANMLMTKDRDAIPNDIARLKGVRYVSVTETEENRRLAESLVKTLTGEDKITARFLHGEFFEFEPTAKFFMATNHKPVIRGTDLAIWRRIRLVPFEVAIPKEEQDPELPQKLQAELSGILNWALEGCKKWQESGLTEPQAVMVATQTYRAESDVLAQFLTDCTVEAEGTVVQAKDLYQAYRQWCDTNGERSISNNAFGRKMKERGFTRVHKHSGKYYMGLGLRADIEGNNVTHFPLFDDDGADPF